MTGAQSQIEWRGQDGRNVAIETRLDPSAENELAFHGPMVLPPFVDWHFHMDARLSRVCWRSKFGGR
jgi:cytosine/adenosine deaminase-related metal-dependent hydrolase